MYKTYLTICAIILSGGVFAQDSTAIRWAQTITAEDIHEHLSILASDSLEGRETGERGQKMAAEYIKNQFKGDGLLPVVKTPAGKKYYQEIDLVENSWKEVYIKYNDSIRENLEDFLYLGDRSTPDEVTLEVVFAGNGSKKDFSGLDVKGKAIAIYDDSVRGLKSRMESISEEKGVKVFFVIYDRDKGYRKMIKRYRHYLSQPGLELPSDKKNEEAMAIFLISRGMASAIFDESQQDLRRAVEKNRESRKNKLDRIKPAEVIFKATRETKVVNTENVLGYIEGTTRKDELIVITAHYDHVGIINGEIYNGADDDGSGTSAVIEMAEAFALAKAAGEGPQRSLLFMTVSGEEKGLLGSDYYTRHPVFPLENTVANLNIDMIGRIDEAHEGNPDYVYLIGADRLSQDLHDLSEAVNTTYVGLELDYTFNEENDPNRYYYRSDHYNFAKNNIPVIFYFNGVHEDYHRPTDDIEKINFEKIEKISKLIFYTAWELANRDERIKLNETGSAK